MPVVSINITDIIVISKDSIRLEFSGSLAVDSNLLNAENYQITPATGIYVDSVLRPSGSYTTNVQLLVRGLQEDQEYVLTLADEELRAINGDYVDETFLEWTHRKTKTDLMISSISPAYDTRKRSNIRGVLEAITISDEEIGGNY